MVYHRCMVRTNIDLDDEACATIMRRYGLASKREAVNLALRLLAVEPLSVDDARAMRGEGWEGNLSQMRDHEPAGRESTPVRRPTRRS